MQKTKIEYLTHTWNPIAMCCTPVSAGCEHCWHLRMTNRLACNRHFSVREREAYRGGDPYLIFGSLSEPMRLRKSAVIGVQFMGDLFHEKVTSDQISAVFGCMAACPHHTCVVLTKRPKRALEWFRWADNLGLGPNGDAKERNAKWLGSTEYLWPLPNVWFGVSVEDQKTAEERVPLLLQIPAAKRFVSAEPLLGPVDMTHAMYGENPRGMNCFGFTDGIGCEAYIQWIVCGAETGPGKRPMNLDWARSLRDQCAAASVPFFFKKDSDGNHELDGRVHEEIPE